MANLLRALPMLHLLKSQIPKEPELLILMHQKEQREMKPRNRLTMKGSSNNWQLMRPSLMTSSSHYT